MKLKRLLVGLLKWLLGLFLFLLLVHSGFNIAGNLKVRAAQQRLVAAGLPMTWEQLFPPPAKETDNAALILNQVFDLMTPDWKKPQGTPFPGEMKVRGNRIEGSFSNDQLTAWIKTVSNDTIRLKHLETPRLKDMPLPQRKECFQKLNSEPYSRVFQLLAEATTKSRCDFQREDLEDLKSGDHLNNSLRVSRRLNQVLKTSKFLYARASLNAEFSHPAEARADIITMLRLANLLRENPSLISQLVCGSVDAMALEVLQTTLREQSSLGFTAADLQALMAALQLTDAAQRNTILASIDSDCLYYSMVFEKGNDTSIQNLPNTSFLEKKYLQGLLYLLGPWTKPGFAMFLDRMPRLRALSVQPYYQSGPELKELCRANNWLTDLLASLERLEEHQTARQIACRGLAAELYRQQHGRYPEKLEELSAFTPVPVDPFTGKPFVYRREGTGFKLYSLGPNQKDDGGVTRVQAKDEEHKNYDIVWDMTSTNVVAEKK